MWVNISFPLHSRRRRCITSFSDIAVSQLNWPYQQQTGDSGDTASMAPLT